MRYAAALCILSFFNPVVHVIAVNDGSDQNGPNALLLFPTIPVSYKGSDTRVVDSARTLTNVGYEVELMFWRDFATELTSKKGRGTSYDDSTDRQNIMDAGVTEIHGPYNGTDTSIEQKLAETRLEKYDAVFFWPWPDTNWLGVLRQMVDAIKSSNGRTQLVAMVEGPGLAVRDLWNKSLLGKKSLSLLELQDYVLSKRKSDLLGTDETDVNSLDKAESVSTLQEWTHTDGRKAEQIFDEESLVLAQQIILEEQYLYTTSDMVVGINSQTVDFLRKIVPGTPNHLVRFRSPITPLKEEQINPFWDRDGLLFLGFDNPTNNMSLSWFVREVMPHLEKRLKLHVVGHVNVPEVCNCNANGSSCASLNPLVVCHGPVDDLNVEALIKSSLVVINPVLTTSGAATTTCRALAYGTPVVVSVSDGTFENMSDDEFGPSAERCSVDDEEMALCYAKKITDLATTEERWSVASKAGPLFFDRNYGPTQFEDSMASLVKNILEKPINVVIEGNAIAEGASLASQNWHIAQTLQNMNDSQYKVRILGGEVTPPIDGVDLATHSFETGYQANIVIRQGWPTPISASSPSYCGVGCRVATMIPWEFGSLPSSWMPTLQVSTDKLWAPSDYNRRMFDASGWDYFRSSVISCGIDCSSLFDKAKSLVRNDLGREVHFVMTGGFLPRKGIDIALEEWSSLFCNIKKTNARLLINSGYEYGYNDDDIGRIQAIVDDCENGSITWNRNAWLSREKYIELLVNADFYLAPFRSEGFGLSIAEAALLGTSVITNVGAGSPAEDYLGSIKDHVFGNGLKAVYPLKSETTECNTFPCQEKSVCVFTEKEDPCEEVAQPPTWFEVTRESLRYQLKMAYNAGVKSKIKRDFTKQIPPETDIEKVCWSNVGEVLNKEIHDVITGPMYRGKKHTFSTLIVGLIKDPQSMLPKTIDFIVELNCAHAVAMHVVVEKNHDFLREAHRKKVMEKFPGLHCAPLYITNQPNGLSSNRVERIKQLREYQKNQIRGGLHFSDVNSSVVILVDLDIDIFPRPNELIQYVEKMKLSSSFPDVLCSNGQLGHDDETGKGKYYDSFATVLLPDTFVYRVKWRKNSKPSPEEDPKFIMSAGFNESDLFSFFQKEGQINGDSGYSPVKVRSCFGGLALFRANKFLDERCSYFGLPTTSTDTKYINKADQAICEHILWNNCMRSVDEDFQVAVQPDMVTTYHMVVKRQRDARQKSVEEGEKENNSRLRSKLSFSQKQTLVSAEKGEGDEEKKTLIADNPPLGSVENGGEVDISASEAVDTSPHVPEQDSVLQATPEDIKEQKLESELDTVLQATPEDIKEQKLESELDTVLQIILDDDKENTLDLHLFAFANIFIFMLLILGIFTKTFKQIFRKKRSNKRPPPTNKTE